MPESNSQPTPAAIRQCAKWLAFCVRIGWPKTVLDDFERLWWQYHDDRGELYPPGSQRV